MTHTLPPAALRPPEPGVVAGPPTPEPPAVDSPGQPAEVRRGLQPGTLPRAGLVGLGLLLLLGAAAWRFGGDPTTTTPLDRYLRMSPTAGAAQLKSDLLGSFPSGTPVAPMVQRLGRQGFTCRPSGDNRGAWSCVAQRPRESRGLTRVEVAVDSLGERIGTVEVRITTTTP